jgi:hypothetical protein
LNIGFYNGLLSKYAIYARVPASAALIRISICGSNVKRDVNCEIRYRNRWIMSREKSFI